MKVLAAALKELIRLGVEGEALIAAIERLEAAAYEEPTRDLDEAVYVASAREDAAMLRERRARDRERKRRERDLSAECPRKSADSTDTPSPKAKSSPTPPKKTQPSPTPPIGPPRPRQSEAGDRLPDEWACSETDNAFAKSKGLTVAETVLEEEKFRNFWHSAGGQNARKRNWSAAWRTWVIRAVEHRSQGPPKRKQVSWC